jgi:hypothetical protein
MFENTMLRYKRVSGGDGYAETMCVRHDGQWVRFTDAQARIDQLEAQLATAAAKGYAAGIQAAAKACDKIAGNTRDFNHHHSRAAGQCGAMIRALLQPTSGPETGGRGEFGQPEDGAPAGGGAVEKGVAEIDTLGAAPAGGWGGKKDGGENENKN